MKKVFAIALALAMVFALCACGQKEPEEPKVDPNAKDEGVLTYDQYVAAAMDSDVVIEGFITAKAYAAAYGNCSLMLQDGTGAYYVYRMPCTDADDAKLTIGQKIKVTGIKAEWSGEVEIKEGSASYEICEGQTYTFEAADVTAKFGTAELDKYQNMFVTITGAKVTQKAIYNWDGSGSEGNDLYFNVEIGGTDYQFLVESDLFTTGSEVYEAVKKLEVGQTVDLQGYLYWYNGPQLWTSAVTVK